MLRTWILAALAALAFAFPRAAHADAKTDTIKIGTLAPGDSPWGQVYKIWLKALHERSKLPDGQKSDTGKDYGLDATFYWNAQQGDEAAMVAKMKSGQLDSAVLTAQGLGQIYKNISALQMPGLFRDWATLDRARDAL